MSEQDWSNDPGDSPAGAGSVSGAAGANPRRDHSAAFVDSSAIVALVDRDDATHAAAVEAYRELVADRYKLVTTNHVIGEAYELLAAGVGIAVARQWLRDHRLAVYHTDEQDEANARAMILEADERRPLSYINAVSLVVMDRLGISDAFAIDPDFLAGTT